MKSLLFLILMIPVTSLLSQEQPVRSMLEIYDITTDERMIVYSEDDHFEAPNWSGDGDFLVFNSRGKLYRLDLKTKKKVLIPTGFADKLNNDHGISPDGKWIAISHHGLPEPAGVSQAWPGNWLESRIYLVPFTGGTPELVTPEAPSFWHGWSPDGQVLVYVGGRAGNFDIYAIDRNGGEEIRLTSGPGLDDGPEFSPDGRHIYYNSMQSGTMEIWKMNKDGSDKRQLTEDSCSNWFPHPSPNGDVLVYLAYLEDQGEAHPPMKQVALQLYDLAAGTVRTLCRLTGGQGTINVPSWSPDGKRFAFVSYEYVVPKED